MNCSDLPPILASRIARLSPNFCNDPLRFFSLGRSEATWWNSHVFSVPYENLKEVNKPQQDINPYVSFYYNLMRPSCVPKTHVDTICSHLRNPGFYDPFNSRTDVTLQSYGGWYRGKLDWLLFRGVDVVAWELGALENGPSDHAWLSATVQIDGPLVLGKDAWVKRDPLLLHNADIGDITRIPRHRRRSFGPGESSNRRLLVKLVAVSGIVGIAAVVASRVWGTRR